MNFTDLDTFVLVADQGTMKGAAAKLGVPTSTVSRRIARLEDDLGVTLLRRAHRTFTLTEDARYLVTRCAPLLAELSDVVTTLSDQRPEPRGVLRLTAPQDLGATDFVAQALARFMERWPSVQLNIVLTNRAVALADEGFDVALRAHGEQLEEHAATLMVRRMGDSPIRLFASARYVERHGALTHPDDLTAHVYIANTIYSGTRAATLRLTCQDETHHTVDVSPALEANDFGLLLALARAGTGICALPQFLAGPHQRRGDLVRILPNWTLPQSALSLLWPKSRHMAPRIRAFIDFMAETFKANEDFV